MLAGVTLQGREGDAHPWWEQAATPGGRSSEGCSTQEAALMDVPSPGSVSNGCAPMLRAEPYRCCAARAAGGMFTCAK